MRMNQTIPGIVVFLSLAGCGIEVPANQAEVGQPAPEYAAVSLGGDSVSLADHAGEVVLLNVWATWCHPCREEIPVLQALHEQYAEEDLRVVGVSVDTRGERSSVVDFAESFGMTYPIWLDPGERVSSTFRTLGVPSTFLIDRSGTIVWKHLGPIPPDDPGLTAAIEGALSEK